MTSLLGTGVTLEGRFGAGLGLKLECVLSLRCRGSSCFMADAATLVVGEEAGPLALAAPEDLAKKPRMLCCLPVDTVPAFFAADTALAGVRAGAVGFSPMTTDWRDGEVVESKYVSVQLLVPMVALQSQQHIQVRARCGRQRVLERGGSGHNHFKGGTGDTGTRRARMEVASSASGKKKWCLRQVSRMRVAREWGCLDPQCRDQLGNTQTVHWKLEIPSSSPSFSSPRLKKIKSANSSLADATLDLIFG